MRLSQQTQEVVRSPDLTAGVQFSIHDTHKIISWVVDKMYADKITSPVREIICNAYDAHIISGQTKPFRVILPTDLDPQLIIQDFGSGLSRVFMEKRFTAVGDTTKDQDDTQVGAFGAGRLSPFTYADMFTVTTKHLGWEGVFALSRDEHYRLNCNLLAEGEADASGVTVAIPISPEDLGKFRQAVRRVLSYFPEGSYELIGAVPIKNEYVVEFPDWAFMKPARVSSYWAHEKSRLVMGPVAYELDWTKVAQRDDVRYSYDFPSEGVEIRVPLGAVSIQPNREQLSYDERTRAVLETIRLRMVNEYQDHIRVQVATAPSLWDAIVLLGEARNDIGEHSTFRQNFEAYYGDHKVLPGCFGSIDGLYRLTKSARRHAGQKYRFQPLDDLRISRSFQPTILWHNCQGQRGYSLDVMHDWASRTYGGTAPVLLIRGYSTLEAAREALGNPPVEWFTTLSEVFQPLAVPAGTARLYTIDCSGDVSNSDHDYLRGAHRLWLPVKGHNLENPETDRPLLRFECRRGQTVYGLSATYRQSAGTTYGTPLRDFVVREMTALAESPEFLKGYAAFKTNDEGLLTFAYFVRNTPDSVQDPLWRLYCTQFNEVDAALRNVHRSKINDFEQALELGLIEAPELPEIPNLTATIEKIRSERPYAAFIMNICDDRYIQDWEMFFRCLEIR